MGLAVLLFCLSAVASVSLSEPADDMRHRMNDLVDSVKGAVHDAESAGKKREVVDLGQSLHLLESKFSGLRQALQQELGVKSSTLASSSAVATELVDRSNTLIRNIVSQREDLRKLAGDVKEVDSAIRALREGLSKFERDASELNKLMGELHVSHNELRSAHEEAHSSVKELMADSHEVVRKSTHGLFYAILLLEIASLVAFVYFKRPGGQLSHKAYGKFG